MVSVRNGAGRDDACGQGGNMLFITAFHLRTSGMGNRSQVILRVSRRTDIGTGNA